MEIKKIRSYCEDQIKNGNEPEIFNEVIRILDRYQDYCSHGFLLNDVEKVRADQFYEKYVAGRNFGAIGGGMTYHFTPTALGDLVKISTVDPKGEPISEDITNYDTW